MSTFAQLRGPRPAPLVTELPVDAFADDWEMKPSEPMRIGLRLVGEGDIEKARAAAIQRAIDMIPEPGEDRIEAFNDAVMAGVVARATCMPDNVTEPFFEMPEDHVRDGLTPEGIRLLWDAYNRLKVVACDYLEEATADQLVDLAALLGDEEAWAMLPGPKAKALKRLAHYLLDELDPEIRE